MSSDTSETDYALLAPPSDDDRQRAKRTQAELQVELGLILDWVYKREHRGERVSERLKELVEAFEAEAWERSHHNLPFRFDDQE